MELSAAHPSPPLILIQNHPKTRRPSCSANPLLPAPSRNRFSAVPIVSLPSSIPSNSPKAASALMNSLHNHFTGKPSLRRKLSATRFVDLHQKHISTQKAASSLSESITHLRIPDQNRDLLTKGAPFVRIPDARVMYSLQNCLSSLSHSPLLRISLKLQIQLSVMSVLCIPLPSFASETEQISDKINIESILISIDNFFNRYPFFVAGVTFVWLVVIPLTQEYLKKYKYISVINAFRKLREDPSSQLLDIRKKQSRAYLDSPNLKILSKNVVQVEFSEGQEEDFVKEVLKNFQDPSSTVVCVLDKKSKKHSFHHLSTYIPEKRRACVKLIWTMKE